MPGGTEGVAYDSEKEPCLLHHEEENGVPLDVEWWNVAQFKLSRESNTFASLGGTRDWFDKAIASPDEYGRLPLDLGFDFPIAGVTFSQVNVGVWGAGVWAGGGKGGGPELAVSLGNVAWDFDCTSNPDDGIFIEKGSTKDKDPVPFTTIKWVGHAPSKEGDPAPLNFAVTLYADGCVRFIYGACGDPNDKEKSFQAGWVSVFGSNGNDRSTDWYFDDYDTPLSESFEDLVFSASSLPPGMELVPWGDGKHARLTGTPIAAPARKNDCVIEALRLCGCYNDVLRRRRQSRDRDGRRSRDRRV